MTYCLAMKLDEGLVFCSDSRTNAGADRVSAFSKMHRFSLPDDRQIALLSSGNLGTTQAVIEALERDMREAADINLASAPYVSDLADYVGRLSRDMQNKYAPEGEEAGFNAEASFILGGQIKGAPQELYLIYPEGNHIHPSERFPFFQIGETKYGRPILDRIVAHDTPREIAMRCALVSMDSTMRSNATVGPPIELLFLRADNFSEPNPYHSFEATDPTLLKMRAAWNEEIVAAFNNLPSIAEVFSED
ncbi:MAG: peptidase [Pseudomonadota bacterium]